MQLPSRDTSACAIRLSEELSFVDVLRERARSQPQARVFTFLDEGGSLTVVRACTLLREELKQDVPITHFSHQERADARRQALQRCNPRGTRGNG